MPQPSARLGRKLLLALAATVLALLAFVAVELVHRAVWTPPPGFVAYRFHTALNHARWVFLHEHRAELAFECTAHEPDLDEVDAGEEDAPPFDRVMVAVRIRTNADGFRDGPFRRAKAPARRRILFLGDSTGYGKGIEEEQRFASVLRAALPPGIELYNLALQGCTTTQLAELYAEHGEIEHDLVLVQAPGNDYDQALWHLGGAEEPSWLRRLAAGLSIESFLLQRLSWSLHGDPNEAALDAALARSEEVHREDFQSLLDMAALRGAKVAVLSLIRADGRRYGVHLVKMCRERPETCLGVVEVDFDDLARWIPDALPPASGPDPLGWPWLEETADALDLDVAALEAVLPYHRLFHDIIHPNARGNLLIGRQLAAWLRVHWDGWGG